MEIQKNKYFIPYFYILLNKLNLKKLAMQFREQEYQMEKPSKCEALQNTT